MKKVKLFADGSSLGNPGPGGWGVVLEYNGIQKQFSGGEKNTTNNKMELTAIIEGLKKLKEPCEVEIISDSNYVIKAINEWLDSWIKTDWKKGKVKNIELWKKYLEVSKPHKIKATWIKGHNGHRENEICDKLAKNEASKFR